MIINNLSINLNILQYKFIKKPLLIGGKAMEFYKIRKAGKDIDLVVSAKDYERLAKLYPKNKKNLFGDLGVCIKGFEIWKTICLFDYDYLAEKAIEKGDYKIISLEKLVFLKALGMHKQKYLKDLKLIVKKIFEIKYKNKVT